MKSALLLAILAASCVAQPVITVTDLTAGSIPAGVNINTNNNNFLSGVALLDYDNDNDLDIVLANGRGSNGNVLLANNGIGVFSDVSAAAGINDNLGHLSVVVGDINNDGCQDIYFTGEGGIRGTAANPVADTMHRLYVSNCGGATGTDFSFTDQTAARLPTNPVQPSMATFGDIDNDGDLDLFVAGGGQTAMVQDSEGTLFRNDGAVFTDISALDGIDQGNDLGTCMAAFAHFDDDDLIDLLTADCGIGATPMGAATDLVHFYRNLGNNVFQDNGAMYGTQGMMGAWMGITFSDYDNDGDMDFFTSNAGNLNPMGPGNTPHVLWRSTGVGAPFTPDFTTIGQFEFGWGSLFADFNLDTYDDLVMVGTAETRAALPAASTNPGTIVRNNGDGTFTEQAGLGFTNAVAGMNDATSGIATGDLTGDGIPDIVVARKDEPGSVLCNPNCNSQPFIGRVNRAAGNTNGWAIIRLVGTVSNADGIGARVELEVDDEDDQIRTVMAGAGAFGSPSTWLHFGLGDNSDIDRVTIRWPSGQVDEFEDVDGNQLLTFVEGSDSYLI